MDRLRRRRGDKVPDEWRELAPRRDAPGDGHAASLLDLQARAGNRAVSELVGAHGPDAGVPAIQRDGADGAPGATPADDKGAKPRADTMSIPELSLAVPLQSFQGSTGGTSGRGPDGGARMPAEVTVGFAAEHMSSRLLAAIAKGRQFNTVTITLGAMTIALHGVVISGYQMGKDTASMTLSYSSIEIDPGPRPPSGPND